MTNWRLFPSTNGPSSPVSYTGNILTGVLFKVTQGGMWFNGYYKWVATGEDTTARKFALWQITGTSTATLISAATVTSGTLTAGQWNFVPLATPVPLAIGTAYNACTGWAAVSGHGFSDSDTSGAGTGAADSYGTGGHTVGITQGPLFAFSDGPGSGGTKYEPYTGNQGVFGTAGTDPTVNMPSTPSNSGNFWMDVQVSDTGPAGYSGSYRLYPNKFDSNNVTAPDSHVNYSVATEFRLSQPCTLDKIWYYSPSGTAQLATSCRIWSIQGANAGTSVVTNTSPSWSGAAASGWVSCSFTGIILPAGSYKASVYNGAGSPDGWGAKDASTNYWATGDGANGITWGPLYAPGLSAASTAYEFGGTGGSTPPFSNGLTEPGQSTFVNGNGDFYPYLYVDGLGQNYWLDVEVTPLPFYGQQKPAAAPRPLQPLTRGRGSGKGRKGILPAAIVPTAGVGGDSGSSQLNSQTITVPAGILGGDIVFVWAIIVPISATVATISAASTGTTPVAVPGGNITGSEPLPATVTGQLFSFVAAGTTGSASSDVGKVITLTYSTTGFCSQVLQGYSGTGISSPVDVIGSAFGGASTASVTCPTKTTGVSGDWALFFGGGAAEGAASLGIPAGSTSRRADFDSSSEVCATIADSNVAVGAAGTSIGGGTFTTPTATNSILVALTVGLSPPTTPAPVFSGSPCRPARSRAVTRPRQGRAITSGAAAPTTTGSTVLGNTGTTTVTAPAGTVQANVIVPGQVIRRRPAPRRGRTAGTRSAAPLLTVTFASTSGGIDTWNVTSQINNTGAAGTQQMRVLAPTAPNSAYTHSFLLMLPVETGQGTTFGDSIGTARTLNAHNQYNVTCIQPGYPVDPWYADNPLDPTTQQETFTLALTAWITANLRVTGTEKTYLIGFSKSGIGGQGLQFRHPAVFAATASWDAPFAMTDYDGTDPTHGSTVGGNSSSVYGTSANFTANYELDSTNLTAWKNAANFGTVNRIWIGGFSNFTSDVAAYESLLGTAGIQATTTWSAGDTHAWDTGWVAAALAWMFPAPPASPPPSPGAVKARATPQLTRRGAGRGTFAVASQPGVISGTPGLIAVTAPAGQVQAYTGITGRVIRPRVFTPRPGTGRGTFLIAPVPGVITGTPGLIALIAPAGTVSTTSTGGATIAGPAGRLTLTAVVGTITAVTGTPGRQARSRTAMPPPARRGHGRRGTIGTAVHGPAGTISLRGPAGTVQAWTGTPGKITRSRTATPPHRGTAHGIRSGVAAVIAGVPGTITAAGQAGGIAATVPGTAGRIAVSGPAGFVVLTPYRYTRWDIERGFIPAGPRSHLVHGSPGTVKLTAPAGTVAAR